MKQISALAHSLGAVVVIDGAQALGMNVNVTDLGVDACVSALLQCFLLWSSAV